MEDWTLVSHNLRVNYICDYCHCHQALTNALKHPLRFNRQMRECSWVKLALIIFCW